MNDTQSRPKILVVDDKPPNIYVLEKLLASLDADVLSTTSGFEALAMTLEHDFCLAIVDIQMPEMDGYELVELLRGNPTTADLPVIFVSAIFSDEYHHRKGYEAGAVDFLSKPFTPEILVSKVRVFLDLYNQRMKVAQLAQQNEILYETEKNLRQVEEERARELTELNASKDKFFSIVSHDLRTPFNGLIGLAHLMVMELEGDEREDLRNYAASILSSAQNAHRLLENLLSWSQIQRGTMKPQPQIVAVAEVAQETIDMLQETADGKNIRLVNAVEKELVAYVDPNMLSTILRNLISNSIKFTPAGGIVTMMGQQFEQTENGFKIPCVEISVNDTGIGIDKLALEKIFQIDVHYTTEGTAGERGGGLGLILCQELIEYNGGQMQMESKLGGGTTVKFTLPMVDTAGQES
jgi:signal transduction histidine kinase